MSNELPKPPYICPECGNDISVEFNDHQELCGARSVL